MDPPVAPWIGRLVIAFRGLATSSSTVIHPPSSCLEGTKGQVSGENNIFPGAAHIGELVTSQEADDILRVAVVVPKQRLMLNAWSVATRHTVGKVMLCIGKK